MRLPVSPRALFSPPPPPTADGEANDSVVFDDVLLDSRKWKTRMLEAAGADAAQIAVETSPSAQYRPSPEEMAGGEGGDPDLPVSGDVTLTVELDFSLLSLGPTTIILRDELVSPEAKEADPQAGEISVRFFLRVTAYTGFSAEQRAWGAKEVILYRPSLTGTPVAPSRVPLPLPQFVALLLSRNSAYADVSGVPVESEVAAVPGGSASAPGSPALRPGASPASPRMTPSSPKVQLEFDEKGGV